MAEENAELKNERGEGEPQTGPQPASQQAPQPAPQPEPQATQQPAPPQPGYQPIPQPPAPAAANLDGKATGALVCGILAIVFSGTVLAGIGLGIAAIILGCTVLKTLKDNGKAKAGKITGIVGIVLSALMLVLYLVVGISAFTFLTNNTSAVDDAVDTQMAALQNMDDADLLDFSDSIDEGFSEYAGISLADLGVDPDEFARWLVSDISYTITNTDVQSDAAVVTMTIQSRDFETFMDTFETDVISYTDSSEYQNLTSMSDLYQKLGNIMKADMQKTGMTSHTETLRLSKTNGTWTVNESSFTAMMYDMFGL